ncbi:flagellin modification protein A [Shewanella sp. D64]|uniref:oxidoreductase n=1 Tax=unclassified Shewanella TaxID=196818 RepID=UPI0022BA507E|nr:MULTISPECIES: oxidoreductase [unclassified Shewanella]MEC4726566.1 flagellin modification protein A [Shewanella sp. D64]MEC4737393.1 flagellin modification protein A [Shewanella sp. E94]WBJ97212.1 flagellin modification protein A [Shewanella sp. MTB7]
MLKGKTILITGAGGLLGSQLTSSLVTQGAKVIATDISMSSVAGKLAELLETESECLSLVELDSTDELAMKEFFSSQAEIDGAVNCTYPRNKQYGTAFLDVSLDSFNENISLHLGSSFLFMQQCAAQFIKQQTPMSVVNISSIYGVVAPKFAIYDGTPMTMPVEYAAIKSALLHLNKYVAAFVKDSRFRVNSISPGGIFDNQPEEFLAAYKNETHGHGMLSPKDLTGSITFLLSDQSTYITGQNLIIDDGFTV